MRSPKTATVFLPAEVLAAIDLLEAAAGILRTWGTEKAARLSAARLALDAAEATVEPLERSAAS